MAKNQADANQHPEAEPLQFEDYSHSRHHPKIIGHTLKNKQKNKCVCIHEIIRIIIMEIKMKKKNRSHRYNINRPRSRHGHNHIKYEKCTSMIMLICI